MQIRKFSKLKNGQYKLIFDNQELIVHEDIILKRNLLIYKELDDETIEKIRQENIPYQSYNLALKYLSHGFKSKQEIIDYLTKKNTDLPVINEVIQKLEKEGYINDQRYANAFIHDKMSFCLDGPSKIVNELLNKGVSKEIIDKEIFIFDESLQEERIENIIKKQVTTTKNKSNSMLKSKITNYLINMGYDNSLIYKHVNKISIDDSLLQKKEYDKLYKKLSSKYSGAELEYRIKQKMYQKGFRTFQ